MNLRLNPDKNEFVIISGKHPKSQSCQNFLCHSFKALFHRKGEKKYWRHFRLRTHF